MVVKGHARGNDVDDGKAFVGDGRLKNRLHLFLVPAEGAGHERGAPPQSQSAAVERWQLIDSAGLKRGTEVRRSRELALGQTIYAVVFDDVYHGQVAAHHVHELTDAYGRGIAIAADTQTQKVLVSQQCAGSDGRHTSVDRVEAVRQAQEVGRRLGRAADTGKLGDGPGLHPQLIEALHDALGNGVVSAAGAQRGLAPLIIHNLQPDAVDFLGRRSAGDRRGCRTHLPSCLTISSVTVRASSGRPP